MIEDNFAEELDDFVDGYLEGEGDPKERLAEVISALTAKIAALKSEQSETGETAEDETAA